MFLKRPGFFRLSLNRGINCFFAFREAFVQLKVIIFEEQGGGIPRDLHPFEKERFHRKLKSPLHNFMFLYHVKYNLYLHVFHHVCVCQESFHINKAWS